MIHFRCTCGGILFFENTTCLQCGLAVGYDPASSRLLPLGDEFRRCENGVRQTVCNWLVPQSSPAALCRSCQLTRTIPDLSLPGHLAAWQRMEAEKRRLLYSLARLGLSPLAKSESPSGLAFDFLAPTNEQPTVLTGHADGVITMNIREADDVYREHQRRNLHEPSRTLIGHFRHEIGHYFWDRFFRGRAAAARLAQFRELFGDERADYQAALANHYQSGPAANWADAFITAYASVHPWEDWAETWAHYLHIMDAVETAAAFGWIAEAVPMPFTPFTLDDLDARPAPATGKFLHTLNTWAKISPALNEIAASLGHPNLYPFVLSKATARKLHFVHRTIAASACVERGQAA